MGAGAERVKEALQALGMKCGGTLRQRAERLMQAKGKRLEELDRSLFAKGAAPAVRGGGDCSRLRYAWGQGQGGDGHAAPCRRHREFCLHLMNAG